MRARIAALAAAVSLLWTGCAQMPPFEALFDDSPEALGTGITGVGLVRAVVIIARYQATPHQRTVVEHRARQAVAKLRVSSKRSMAPAPKRRPAHAEKAAPASKPAPAISPKSKPSASESAHPKEKEKPAKAEPPEAEAPKPVAVEKKIPRYIAVDTEPDERSRGKKSVMIWDSYSEKIVGNEVYDLEATPKLMQTARFETYSAQYVGTGSL